MAGKLERLTLLCLLAAAPGCNELIATGRFGVRDGSTPPRDGGGTDGGGMDAGPDGGMDGGVDACASNAWYRDSDEDTYGDPGVAMMGCAEPTGYVANADDCDDTTIAIAPGVAEVCDDVDQDCDGAVDEGLMGPVGDVIELVPVGCCREFTVVGTPSGAFVAWADDADGRVHFAFVSRDPTAAPMSSVGPVPTRGNQTNPSAVLFESALASAQVAVAWQETDLVRMQILPADGSSAPTAFDVLDAVSVQLADQPLGVVGDRVAVLMYGDDVSSGEVRVRLVDPVLAEPDGAVRVLDLDPAGLHVVTVPVGWAGLDAPAGLIAQIIQGSSGADRVLTVFDVSGSSVTWRGASANLEMDATLGDLRGARFAQPARGSSMVPATTSWRIDPDTSSCFSPLGVGPALPTLGTCVPLMFDSVAISFRANLASMILLRGTLQLSLLEQPLTAGATGTPLVTIAERLQDTSGAELGMYGAHGGLAYVDLRLIDDAPTLRYQRIGCE